MAISSINNQRANVKAEDIPLEKLAGSKALTEQQKTAEAARQFETLLVRQILTEAQKPAFKSKFSDTGVSNSVYQDMMVNQLADKITSSHSLGLAQQLGQQFKHESRPGSGAPVHRAPIATHTLPKHSSTATAAKTTPIHPTKAPR